MRKVLFRAISETAGQAWQALTSAVGLGIIREILGKEQ
jgi:hypothetical protein